MFKWLKSLVRRESLDVSEHPFVIGREIAAASAADQKWQEQRDPNQPALLPSGYDHLRGDLNLINPAPNDLDEIVRNLCRRYSGADQEQRSSIQDSISMDEFYSLLTFCKRTAVFAMRKNDSEMVVDGLTALTMIEQDRVDFRDILMCLALLYHAAVRLGANADELFRRLARLAEPNVAEMLDEFVTQSSDYRDLRSSWGLAEVETKHGIGFIGWGFEAYEPTIDLKRVAVELAEVIATDKYHPGSIEVATVLPAIWLTGDNNPRLNQILKGIRGSASISASALPDEVPNHDSQQFTVFLVETANATDSEELLRISKSTTGVQHCNLGTACGKLFCLIVARSFIEGVVGYETQGSLMRFSDGVSETLASFAG